ncbi:YVTN family beta-propeller protein [Kribbella rubisoli]|uniref:YVTN family beta-propeller protein n=1 Tax=Kribbella rubisoli TaxID=3075929 RepID=A0A4Q7WLT2_9ACTN|nr:YVTN family beta-propeller protein [Kribbella rubisoli]
MQVTRRRRRDEKGSSSRLRRRVPLVAAGTTAVAVTLAGTAVASTTGFGHDQVGQVTDKGQVISSDQYIKPLGDRLVLQKGKIMSSTTSPDGSHLAAGVTDGGMALAIVDLKNWKVQQYVGNNAAADLKIPGNDIGQEGPTYSPDGKQLWLGQTDGYRKFDVNADGSLANPTFVSIAADGAKHALASEAVFSADSKTVYAAVNGQNRVVAIDAASGTITQSWATGNAPRDMVMVGSKLYVTNEGGRTARPGDSTLDSYGTPVVANQNSITTTGTVSVIDTKNAGAAVGSIPVGLHPTAVYAKNGAVFVANTSSNTVSVINTKWDKVAQTITTQPWAEAKVGYEPNGIALTDDGHLLVSLGRANAVAVYKFRNPLEPVSYVGLLPTDYFPAELAQVGKDIVVSNTRGIDARRDTTAAGRGTHDTTSSLTKFKLPDDHAISKYTATVFAQNGWTKNSAQLATDKGHRAPVAVPAKLGDPSTIKHVFLLVKENRTYDQVYGDMPEGNGDPALTQYGENVTPNQHALAKQFGLYDNTYDVGTNSAEGHNWLMQADNPEYTESSAGEYLRSYDTENDALGHQASGFIWTGAQAAGKTVKDYGEFLSIEQKPAGASWQNLYCDTKQMQTGADTKYPIQVGSAIPSLNKVAVQGFPQFDTTVPDIYKEQVWEKDFKKNGPANLNMFWYSNDHTGGTANGPAQVADNDLAVGRTVDAITHSKYWKDSAIFVVEDDSQAGLDHIDGHRAPIQIISPYAQHGVTDSHYYTQITMMRTIEQILGIHPMNQKDTAATPMFGAFTNKPNYSTFTTVPNRTSLTGGVNPLPACGADVPAAQNPNVAAAPTAAVPAGMETMAATWSAWKDQQRTTGPNAKADFANPSQMNHYDWYEAHNWATPYPGEAKIVAPNDVPGAIIPANENDG